MTAKRPPFEVFTAPQLDLFGGRPAAQPDADLPRPEHADDDIRFVDKDPRDLFINGRRLDDYLEDAGQTSALHLRSFLGTLDYADFIASYEPKGRQPYAPWAMLGIVVYGLFKGVTSLRDLESLARTDLGCMWMSGGICPDHSILGRFLVRHRVVLTEAFFEQMTTRILRQTDGGVAGLAVDGTIVQAAASRLRTLRREAARAAAEQAIAEARAAGGEQEAVELERVLAGDEPADDEPPGYDHPGTDEVDESGEQSPPTSAQRQNAKRRRTVVEAAEVGRGAGGAETRGSHSTRHSSAWCNESAPRPPGRSPASRPGGWQRRQWGRRGPSRPEDAAPHPRERQCDTLPRGEGGTGLAGCRAKGPSTSVLLPGRAPEADLGTKTGRTLCADVGCGHTTSESAMPSPRLTLIVAVAACALLGWAAPASAEPADASTLTQLVLVVDDLDSTLSRARHAAALTPYHPAISSALAEAESARLEVAWIAARKGPLAALWHAGEARELALLVLEQARVAWMAGAVAAAPPVPSGSGGEIR